MRVLITGWPSFRHGEATAGDVLSMRHVAAALSARGIPNDLAWSPVLVPGQDLDRARPADYTHLVFVCGPARGWQVEALHERYAGCHRVAVGVSVLDPQDPAVVGFHHVFARDGGAADPALDLATPAPAGRVPVAGVALAPAQPEYGTRRRHEEVHRVLVDWLTGVDCAALPLDTRLDPRDWRCCSTVDQFTSLVDRTDVVITSRLHGLVFGLSRGRPVLAADPIAGGAKVAAQAAVWRWPAVLRADEISAAALDRWWAWCCSPAGRDLALRRATTAGSPLVDAVVAVVRQESPCA
ncbi:polysaccharide pyruvyl transferase family protein [Saccharopolyspora thermophila]|uniref:polysaccharide pyruvyl transferase family protein n=1 Tax=Saccharopolyspora thermophila TaxID=89367 RepID=UPI00166B9E27|nr:polysaccharide pyruvyl transferase family protein [Saccharopolyspora subtropica]